MPKPKPVTLADVMITDELLQRSARPANLAAENQAMHILIRQMVNQPEIMLKSLITMALELCSAGTAGVSLIEVLPTGEKVFRWVAIAGALEQYQDEVIDVDFSPCGVCLERGIPMLYSYPERYFTYLQAAKPVVVEALVLPLIVNYQSLGTLWIVSHDEQRRFDSEDVRMMTSLADFTTTALILKDRRTQELLSANAALEARIIDHQKAEMALRESEKRLQQAIAISTVGVIFFRTNGRITDSNETFLKMSGYSREDLRSGQVRWDKMTPLEFMPQTQQAIQELLTLGRTIPYEKQYIRKDGSRWWGLFAASQLNDDEAVEFIIDITENKRSQELLQTSEERLRLASYAANFGTYDFEPQTGQCQWSSLLKAMHGLSEDTEITFEQLPRYIHPDDHDRIFYLLNQYLSPDAPGPYEHEFRIVRTDGTVRWVIDKGCVFFTGEGEQRRANRVIGVILDITERKQAEAERNQLFQEQAARKEAERASQMKDEFLAMISHELQSPLVAILGWSRLLRTQPPSPTMLRKSLETIERNASVLAKLISDLLDISRITAGKVKLNLQPVELISLIETVIRSARELVAAKKLNIIWWEEVPENVLVLGDLDRLQQIISNLLNNAIKFTPELGCISVKLSVIKSQVDDFSCAEISITDTGIGISAEFLPHVFERFRQAHSSGGLGLGLAIARHLVELHNGTIHADSLGEGQGATFKVRLPLLNNDECDVKV
ncbi:hypothetical protein C7H19_16805 [Aphanothece hegewaldii CCALA 016]|uniref:histidine kinase n=1 Tax=Aphanothece hegewaldii CCALA 016 TaxID=2107694 RepID=A0A2T1LUY8_9CHRO|nr:GAF domain-containing sensor histidine kinase [Aphanothece hegewaldii]PSF35439.1 hypothetical protein C7H19_16805 [Aphanothece hegewaldii CCALA 016]